MEYKTIIDSNGYITNMCVIYKDGKVQGYEMNENEKIVEYYVVKGYIKPRWNGNEWVEGATEEEIQTWQEENKVVQEPSENETLLSTILLENAELKQKTDDLEEMTATLMLQIAELKGDSTNV